MTDYSHIVFAYTLDGNGGGKELKGDEIARATDSEALSWVHLEIEDPKTRKWMEEELHCIDPETIDALLAKETRPRVTEIGDGALVILRGVNWNEGDAPEDMVSIRIWVHENRIISTRFRKLKAVIDVKERISKGIGPKTPGEFLTCISNCLCHRMEPALTTLDEELDAVEEELIDHTCLHIRQQSIDIRKKAIMYRRYIVPQRDAINQLRNTPLNLIGQRERRQLQENFDHLVRYIEDLDAIRERAQIVKDELANAIGNKLNKNMYVLSVIAAIFLPLGFVTGLLGVNVGGIPGTDNPTAFWTLNVILVGLVIAIVYLFKKLDWF